MNVSFYLHNKELANGHRHIFCMYTHKGKKYRFSTNLNIDPKLWDKRRQRAKTSHKYATGINDHLQRVEDRVMAAAYQVLNRPAIPYPHIIKNLLEKQSSMTFWEAWGRFKGEYVSTLKLNTQKKFRTTENDLQAFEARDITFTFEELNESWVNRFRKYLSDKGNIHDTIVRKIKDVKVFMKYGHRSGWHENNSYAFWKATYKTARQNEFYLNREQLKKLEQLHIENRTLHRIRDLFLFHCYTGLRYSDGQQIRGEYLQGDVLTLEQEKTEKQVQVKLIPKALEIFHKYQGVPRYSNQKFNQYIKEVARLAKIPDAERITTHTARRSFITIMLQAGIHISLVSKMVGHSDTKQTARYDKSGFKEWEAAVNEVWG